MISPTLAVLFLSATSPAFTQSTPSTVVSWRNAIDTVVTTISSRHPDPFTKRGRVDFLQEVQQLKEGLQDLTDEQRAVRLMKLVASLRDGHTYADVFDPRFSLFYPIRMYRFSDGIFITSAYKTDSDLAGAQVLQIANRPADVVLDEAAKLYTSDNEFGALERIYAAHNATLMRGLGYADEQGRLRLKLKMQDGKLVDRVLTPERASSSRFRPGDSTLLWADRTEVFGTPLGKDEDWTSAFQKLPASAFSAKDDARPPFLTHPGGFVARHIPQGSAYYTQFNLIVNPFMNELSTTVMKDLDKLKPKHFILDLRNALGGDGSTVPHLVRELAKRSENPPWENMYILTGRKTFSATILTLAEILDHAQVTIIGEPAGAAMNHYGDATEFLLPEIGMRFFVSGLFHQKSTSADVRPFTKVDVPAQFSFSDYVAGRDPAVDPILGGKEMRSIAIIAAKEGGVAARRAYMSRLAEFEKNSWLRKPDELDLRNVGFSWLDRGKAAEAVEVAKLNSEINPYIWNTWFNLGSAQRAAGQMQERLVSYRRVLELEPTNWNAPSLRLALAELVRPPVVRFGATLAEMEQALKAVSGSVNRSSPTSDASDPQRQSQLSCEGLEFMGARRKADFWFRDDKLEVVWIQTEGSETERLLEKFSEALTPTFKRYQSYIAFSDSRVAIRTERPAVLFYSREAAPEVLRWFETQ